MRIACICNQNNNMFSLARYLRARGLDAHVFLLDNEAQHFGPACDTFDSAYAKYVHRALWGTDHVFWKTDFSQIAHEFRGYDRIIACGNAIAFLTGAGIRIDVLIPYGDDLYRTPFLKPWKIHPWFLPNYMALSAAQRRGIRNARHIVLDSADANFEGSFERLHPAGTRHLISPPALFLPEYRPEEITRHYGESALAARLQEIRKRSDVVLFHHSRHHWIDDGKKPKWVLKANDVILRGLRQFLDSSPDVRVQLVTFEYGQDVEASKTLAKSIRLQDNITWLPVSPRKEVMTGLSLADIGVGEVYRSWFSYGVMMEILCSGRPFIGRRDPGDYPGQDRYPMVSIKSPDEFSAALSDYVAAPARWREMGSDGQAWLDQRFRTSVDRIVSMLEETR